MSAAVTRVLGIDTSLRRAGYGIVESAGGRLRAVLHGCVRTRPAWTHSACLLAIQEQLGDVIREATPGEAAIEGAFFCRNVRTAMTLGEARGVALATCAAHGIPVYEYAPRRVKMAVVGTGGAEKEQVMKMVVRLLGIDGTLQEDAADALALAICRLHAGRGLSALEEKPV